MIPILNYYESIPAGTPPGRILPSGSTMKCWNVRLSKEVVPVSNTYPSLSWTVHTHYKLSSTQSLTALRSHRFCPRSDLPPLPEMNDADVSKQIEQMVRFIRQEAEEKANEITAAAEEEFNIEKLQLVEAEKKKIKQEYEKKEKQVEIRRKIEYSMQLNASRLKVLQAQDDLVNSMKEEAGKELLHVSHDLLEYRHILKELIVQCLLRLKEPSVLLRCREHDFLFVETVLHSARNEYAEKANVHPPEILVDRDVYLPPKPSHHHEHGLFCAGGVVLASRDGKIVCENTLDARLDVVFRKKLPEIRKRLFGQVVA